MSDWAQTACILCECNCGIEVQLDGRRLERIRGDKAHPGSQGYTCNKAMRLDRYQNGPHRLTSPMRRKPDGSYEEIDWDTAVAAIAAGFKRIAEEHGGESILYYGGGGQGNHLGGSYSGAFLRALGSKYRSSALAQEKTGEGWVEHSLYGSHTRGEFERAEVAVFVGKNPWMSQSFPRARVVLREISRGPGAVDDRDRPRRDRHGQAGRLPPARAAGHGRLVPGRDGRGAGAGGSGRPRVPRGARERCRGRARTLRPGRRRGLRGPLRGGRGPHPRRRSADRRRRERVGVRGPRHPAGAEQHALLLRQPDALDPDRQLRQPRRDAPPHVVREPVPRPDGPPDAGHRRADPRRARALQRDPGRDPHGPPEALPGDDRGELQPSSLARRLAALPQGVRGARPRPRDRRGDDRDRPPGRLRAAGREPVREGRGDVLQLRVPRQHLPPAPPVARAAAGNAPRGRDLGAPRPRRSASWTTPSSRGCARPPRRAGRRTPRPSPRRRRRTRCSPGWRRMSCTRRSGRRCPRASRARPPSGGSPTAAR